MTLSAEVRRKALGRSCRGGKHAEVLVSRPLDAKIGSPEEEIFVHKNQIEDGTEGENYAALAQGVGRPD